MGLGSARDFYTNFLMGAAVVDRVDFQAKTGKAAKNQQRDFMKEYKAKGYSLDFDEALPADQSALAPVTGSLKGAYLMGPETKSLVMGTSHDYFAGYAGKVGGRETDAKKVKDLLVGGHTQFDVGLLLDTMARVDSKTEGQYDGRSVKSASDAVAFNAMIASRSTPLSDIRPRFGIPTDKTSLDFAADFIAAKNQELNISEGQAQLDKIKKKTSQLENNKLAKAASTRFSTMSQVLRYRGALRG